MLDPLYPAEYSTDYSPDATQDLADGDWQEQIAQLLRRPENLRSVHQPVVDLRSGACVGYEALVRVAEWPARSPQPWFRAASRTGLAAQLEAAALAASLRGRATMPGERFLVVNLGSSCLSHPAIGAVFNDQDDVNGIVVSPTDPEGVTRPGPEREALDALRARGVLVAVSVSDAGRPELATLLSIRPDLVTLDVSMIRDVHADPLRQRLVRLVVDMAGEFDATALAQGVESLDDARFLQFAGVSMAQGWLFGRARPGFLPPPDEVAAWLVAAWEESTTLTRLGRLAVPVPRVGEVGSSPWQVELDGEGRLRGVHTADGVVDGRDLLRLRASQPIRVAARRILGAPPGRRAHGLVAVVDDASRFVGLAEESAVLREAIDGAEPN